MKNIIILLPLALAATPVVAAVGSTGSTGGAAPGAGAPSGAANSAVNSPTGPSGAIVGPNRTGETPSSVNNANPMSSTGITNANPNPATGSDAIHTPGATLSHQEVMSAQKALSANGYNVTQDGIAGASTKTAVRQFQAKHGLPTTGELDTRTLQELNAATQSIPPPSPKATETPMPF